MYVAAVTFGIVLFAAGTFMLESPAKRAYQSGAGNYPAIVAVGFTLSFIGVVLIAGTMIIGEAVCP